MRVKHRSKETTKKGFLVQHTQSKDLKTMLSGRWLTKSRKERLKMLLLLGALLALAYFFLFPTIAKRFAQPLFCSEPCQNSTVDFYALPLTHSNEIPSCKFVENFGIVNLVLSKENEVDRRASIRKTWGAPLTYRRTQILTFFLLAKERKDVKTVNPDLISETVENKDLIIVDMIDSYQNLTLKVLAGLTWVNKYCKDTNFVVKVDSDVFLNPFPFIDYLWGNNMVINQNIDFIGGSVCSNCMPRRSFHDQWAISYLDYPYTFYPDYTHGPCYVMSQRSAFRLLLSSPYVRMIPYEDVYFTGIVAGMYVKTPRTSVPGFLGYNGRVAYDTEYYATNLIASHKHDILEVQGWWDDVINFRRTHNLIST